MTTKENSLSGSERKSVKRSKVDYFIFLLGCASFVYFIMGGGYIFLVAALIATFDVILEKWVGVDR